VLVPAAARASEKRLQAANFSVKEKDEASPRRLLRSGIR
jgi:hypothetical protein